MKKILYAIVISMIALLLGACEVFGFQKATLIFDNPVAITEMFKDANGAVDPDKAKVKVKITSTSVGIADNEGNSFSFNLSEEKRVSQILEWWGYTDGEIKVKMYADGELSFQVGGLTEVVNDGEAVASSKSITVKSGSVVIVNPLDLFR